jgi:hypothetical protein
MKSLMWLPFLAANLKIYILQNSLKERKFQTQTTNRKIRFFKVAHSVHFLSNLFYFIKAAKCTHNIHIKAAKCIHNIYIKAAKCIPNTHNQF